MAGQNLPYKALMDHLRHLVSIGLVESEEIGRRRSFSTTKLGIVAMTCYRNAAAQLLGNNSSCPLLSKEKPREPFEIAART